VVTVRGDVRAEGVGVALMGQQLNGELLYGIFCQSIRHSNTLLFGYIFPVQDKIEPPTEAPSSNNHR
jgi:hypothetical protein